ncbi:MAG: hypothetical protein H6917_12075 [Novosphingobium sp.]|nr:hypothetical protein [Novosphingobium sp.]
MTGAIALKLLLLFVLAWNSRFVMDEFWQLGQSKFLFEGLFDTMWPGKAVGFALFYEPVHWFGLEAGPTMLAGRLQTALLACATVAMVYACARAIGEDKTRSLLIVLVLLSFSTFMERIFRTISEPLAVFFAVGALLTVLRGNLDRRTPLFLAGVLAGLSFLATQKAVYFDVALGIALLGDAILARRPLQGIRRGVWLVAGWMVPAVAYCLLFGGTNPLPVIENLFLAPLDMATRGGAEVYGGLRHYVWQTLSRNVVLYVACFAGVAVAMARIAILARPARLALIFTVVTTGLVFAHSEPWPYVFIMALPFLALWSLKAFDLLPSAGPSRRLALIALAASVVLSFATNLHYLRFDNRAQLDLTARADAILRSGDGYFDGIGMLPNRRESTPLWLDRRRILFTLEQGKESEAYRALRDSPPRVILWSYRLDAIQPVIDPLLQHRYVTVSPNIRMVGRHLIAGDLQTFDVPSSGRFMLYRANGQPFRGEIEIDGVTHDTPVRLAAGTMQVRLRKGASEAFLLPDGLSATDIRPGPDDPGLFDGVYN